jgi:putative copper resistance protein D
VTGLEAALAAGRLGQFAGVALAGGGALFQLYGPRRTGAVGLVRTGAVLGVLGAALWLAAQAGTIGEPADALRPAQVWAVAAGTGFGRAGLVRAGLLALAALAATPDRRWRLTASLGLGAAASLAWSGHGAMGDGTAGMAHLAADALHAMAAATWLGALAVLLSLALRRDPGTAPALRAFSGVGIWVVAALVLTGATNSLFMVGGASLVQVTTSLYGRLLGLKLTLFGGMLGLAAANRWRFTVALERGASPLATTCLVAETLLGLAVLGVVAWMGALPPPGMAAG